MRTAVQPEGPRCGWALPPPHPPKHGREAPKTLPTDPTGPHGPRRHGPHDPRAGVFRRVKGKILNGTLVGVGNTCLIGLEAGAFTFISRRSTAGSKQGGQGLSRLSLASGAWEHKHRAHRAYSVRTERRLSTGISLSFSQACHRQLHALQAVARCVGAHDARCNAPVCCWPAGPGMPARTRLPSPPPPLPPRARARRTRLFLPLASGLG